MSALEDCEDRESDGAAGPVHGKQRLCTVYRGTHSCHRAARCERTQRPVLDGGAGGDKERVPLDFPWALQAHIRPSKCYNIEDTQGESSCNHFNYPETRQENREK